jgi:AraC-like DNA-binding protein
MSEHARLQRFEDLSGLEALRATFVRHAFARHTHDEYALCLYDAGCADFECRGATHHLYSGELAAINPGEIHDGRAGDERGWQYRVIYPDTALMNRVTEALHGRARGTPFFPTAIRDPAVTLAFGRLHDALEGNHSLLERESLLWHALGLLVARYAESRAPDANLSSGEPTAVRITREHLERHAHEQVSLESLCVLTGLSAFHLVRVFHRAVGLPPHAYQTMLRVRTARALLLEGRDLVDVALEVGFSDQNHLTKHFKRFHGVTPGRYAQAQQRKTALP